LAERIPEVRSMVTKFEAQEDITLPEEWIKFSNFKYVIIFEICL